MSDSNPTETLEVYLTPKEVAKMLHISPKSLEYWRRSKSRPLTYYHQGRFVRYRLSDVRAFMDSIRCQDQVTPPSYKDFLDE